MLPKIAPMELRLVRDAFDHADYIFELKHDGFRGLAYVERGECRLVSRRGRGLKFPSLAAALAKIPAESAIWTAKSSAWTNVV